VPVFKVYYGNRRGFFMAKKRFKAEQIVLMLREVEVQMAKGINVEEVSRSLGIAPQSYYRWRKEYGGINC